MVKLNLSNIFKIHTAGYCWNLVSHEFQRDVIISPVFSAVDHPISWRFNLRVYGVGYYNWRLSLVAAEGSDCGALAGYIEASIQNSHEHKPWHVQRQFSTTEEQLKKKETSTRVCEFDAFHYDNGKDAIVTGKVTFFELKDVISQLVSNEKVILSSANLLHASSLPAEGAVKMYLNEKYSDVTLSVDGNRYPAHKVMLARCSKVFDAMFEHNMQENKESLVQIKNIDEQVFLQALRYVYTGEVEDMDTLVYDLLAVADRYDIEGLRTFCGNVLLGKLEVNTAVRILLLADSYNANNLKARAIEFITTHSKDVSKVISAEEKMEIKTRPDVMIDLLDLLMNK